MILEVGDIQFLSNAHVLHARTAYKDYPPPADRRHLMRLWLATPENEGGWRLPFTDTNEKKRGGIQVNDTRPRAPLDAEWVSHMLNPAHKSIKYLLRLDHVLVWNQKKMEKP